MSGGKIMKILGLTGGIASGKTTVSTYLKEMGYPIIDADKVSRKVVEPHTEGLKEISHFLEMIFYNLMEV